MLTLDAQTTYVRNGSFEDYYFLPPSTSKYGYKGVLTAILGEYNQNKYGQGWADTPYEIPPIEYISNPKNTLNIDESGCDGWFNPTNDRMPAIGMPTPDYYHKKADLTGSLTWTLADIPRNDATNYNADIIYRQYPFGEYLINSSSDSTGFEAYIGIENKRWVGASGSTDYESAEYVCQRLENPLIKGQAYRIRLAISLTPYKSGEVNTDRELQAYYLTDFGAYFTSNFQVQQNDEVLFNIDTSNYYYINSPLSSYYHKYSANGEFNNDGKHWMIIEEELIPHEEKNYIYIGNFQQDWAGYEMLRNLDDHSPVNPEDVSNQSVGAYYYVDNVEIENLQSWICSCYDKNDSPAYFFYWEPITRQSINDDCCYNLFIGLTNFNKSCWANKIRVYEITNENYEHVRGTKPSYYVDLSDLLIEYNQLNEFLPNEDVLNIGQICFDNSRERDNIRLWVEFHMDTQYKCGYIFESAIECIEEN